MAKLDPNSPKYKFAELIKKERNDAGLDRNEVCDKGGVSRSYQWMIENKKRGIPTIEIIMKFEKGLGLKCGYLVMKAVGILKDKMLKVKGK